MKSQSIKTKSKPNVVGALSDVLSVGAIYILAQVVVASVLILGGIKDLDQLAGRPLIVLIGYILAGIATLGLTLGLMKYRKISFSVLKLKKFHPKDIGYGVIGFIIYLVIAIVLSTLTRLVVGESFDQTQELGLESISGWLLPLTFIALVIMPPIVEEVLFRGFLYGRLKYHRYSMLVSALVTSIAFALVHGQLNVGVDTFVLSMVMIYMLEKRQSLWVTITMHAIKNAMAFLALFVFKIV